MVHGRISWLLCVAALGFSGAAHAADDRLFGQSETVEATNASLPTDRVTRDVENYSRSSPYDEPPGSGMTFLRRATPNKPWYEAFMFNVSTEWEAESDGITIFDTDVGTRIPLFRSHGPPPPLIAIGFSYTDLDAPAPLDLPSELYDVSIGLRWFRPINEQWAVNISIDPAFASDSHNKSSDAWQLRGSLFGIYTSSRWTKWMFGAIATGRDDIPVLPAAGVIWQPSKHCQVDLILPRPRVLYMVHDGGDRQQWVYTGGSVTGGTWAYRRAGGLNEQLTYREWRLVLGWESKPPANPPGVYGPTGILYGAEIGYVFGRIFEFESGAPDIEPDGTVLLRATISR